MTVPDAIQNVIAARQTYHAIKTQADALRHEFHTQYEAVFQRESASKQALTEAEATLRDLALDEYMHTGTKTLAPGVVIREAIRLHYDPDVALAWAMEHQLALDLDVHTFEQLAKVLALPFVESFIEPTVTLTRCFEEESHG
jgi:hypothetical protein